MYGQLGIGASNGNSEQKPSKVNLPFTAVSVLAGASTGFALSDKGDLFGWGKNNAGQLGIKASKSLTQRGYGNAPDRNAAATEDPRHCMKPWLVGKCAA